MALKTFAFIVRGPGYESDTHTATLASDLFLTHVIGVATYEDAERTARKLVAEGVQLIELCGSFTRDEATRLYHAIEKAIPIGVVTYSPEEEQELAKLF
jgi:2-keto-3-deoxy-6-phosphogluconate aldolase